MVNNTNGKSRHLLESIVGKQLSSVEFVRDYVQLRFDGPCLTAITRPTVEKGKIHSEWGMPGYCDMLRDRIGKNVRSVTVNEGRNICIAFEDESTICVSLRQEDYRGAEAVMFDNGTQEWIAW